MRPVVSIKGLRRFQVNLNLTTLGLLVLAAATLACAARTPVKAPVHSPTTFPEATRQPYRLQVGDQIAVRFWGNPQLDQDIVIRPDGMISLPFVDEVEAVGTTPSDLKAQLTTLYKSELATPDISVIVRRAVGQDFFIGGEITRSGSFPVEGGITLYQAILQAGGFRETARRDSVIVIRTVPSGERIAAKVNMRPIISGKDTGVDFVLQAEDMVFVPRVKVLAISDFIQRYFYDLLPVRIVGAVQLFDRNDPLFD